MWQFSYKSITLYKDFYKQFVVLLYFCVRKGLSCFFFPSDLNGCLHPQPESGSEQILRWAQRECAWLKLYQPKHTHKITRSHLYMVGTIIPGIAAGWRVERKERERGMEGRVEEKDRTNLLTDSQIFSSAQKKCFHFQVYINMFSHLCSCATEVTF